MAFFKIIQPVLTTSNIVPSKMLLRSKFMLRKQDFHRKKSIFRPRSFRKCTCILGGRFTLNYLQSALTNSTKFLVSQLFVTNKVSRTQRDGKPKALELCGPLNTSVTKNKHLGNIGTQNVFLNSYLYSHNLDQQRALVKKVKKIIFKKELWEFFDHVGTVSRRILINSVTYYILQKFRRNYSSLCRLQTYIRDTLVTTTLNCNVI
jgi:hypothetical protein